MKVKLLTISLVIFIFISMLLGYAWIDRSVSLTYLKASMDSCSASERRLGRLLGDSWQGLSKAEVLAKLKAEAARHPNEKMIINVEQATIWFEDTQFNFRDGKLINIGEQ